jgi:hypothetical protein
MTVFFLFFKKTSLLYLKSKFDEFFKSTTWAHRTKPTFKIIIRRITDYTGNNIWRYWDIPLYVMKAILGESIINADVVLGEFQLSLDPTYKLLLNT